MPIMLFYLPMILWAGLFNVAQAELTPVPAKARKLPPARREHASNNTSDQRQVRPR
jgi:hypothetical protein